MQRVYSTTTSRETRVAKYEYLVYIRVAQLVRCTSKASAKCNASRLIGRWRRTLQTSASRQTDGSGNARAGHKASGERMRDIEKPMDIEKERRGDVDETRGRGDAKRSDETM